MTRTIDIDPAIIEGIDRDLKDRDNVPPELLEVFNEEADDHLKSLYHSLEEIEKDHASRELVQELRRAAHTLKGAAGAVGLRTITQIAHRMEDLLDRLYDEEIEPSPAQIKLIYQTTDTLQDLAAGTFDREKIRQSVAGLYLQYDQELHSLEEQHRSGSVRRRRPTHPKLSRPKPSRRPSNRSRSRREPPPRRRWKSSIKARPSACLWSALMRSAGLWAR